MNIDDEPDLKERLDRDFEAITPRPAPVEGAIRRGKAIKMRRRIAAAMSVAVVAAIGVAIPLLLLRHATQAPVTHHGQPPGPQASAGLIASGTVHGKSWQIIEDNPAAPAGQPGECFEVSGAGQCELPPAVTESYPVEFKAATTALETLYGEVYRNVTYVTVRLADGTVLTLHPVTVYGTRYVAFAAPLHVAVDSATAYSLKGEIATAIPFNAPDGSVVFTAWLRPGQHGLPHSTRLIGSGTINGKAWSVTAHVGPWGSCVVPSGSVNSSAGNGTETSSSSGSSSGSEANSGTTGSNETYNETFGAISGFSSNGGHIGAVCIDAPSSLGTSASVLGWSPGPPVIFGSAAASVDHVVVFTTPNDKSVPARLVTAGNQKFFAVALPAHTKTLRWVAYDGSGHVVASEYVGFPYYP